MLSFFPRLSGVAIKILEVLGAGCASALFAFLFGASNGAQAPRPADPPTVVSRSVTDDGSRKPAMVAGETAVRPSVLSEAKPAEVTPTVVKPQPAKVTKPEPAPKRSPRGLAAVETPAAVATPVVVAAPVIVAAPLPLLPSAGADAPPDTKPDGGWLAALVAIPSRIGGLLPRDIPRPPRDIIGPLRREITGLAETTGTVLTRTGARFAPI